MRNMPEALRLYKKKDATALCSLIKIKAKDGTVLGMCQLDRDVVYDDGSGDGLVTYLAPVGFQPASILQSAGFEVDNSEFEALAPEYDTPISEAEMFAGKFDYADFVVMEVCYEDLTMGHWVVMSGQLGEMKSYNGVTILGELRSIVDGYRKPVVELDSLTCRAIFGSQPGEERFPCGFDASALWETFTVTEAGIEASRTFKVSGSKPDGYYEPGLVQFLTGASAGAYREVESSLVDGTISLAFEAPYPVAVGDTLRIRVDCNKRARDAAKGCKKHWGAQWPLHFRGEPDVPVGEAGSITTPNAGV